MQLDLKNSINDMENIQNNITENKKNNTFKFKRVTAAERENYRVGAYDYIM